MVGDIIFLRYMQPIVSDAEASRSSVFERVVLPFSRICVLCAVILIKIKKIADIRSRFPLRYAVYSASTAQMY